MANFVKNLQRFRLITFDMTDTLLKFKRDPAEQYVKVAFEHGLTNFDQQKIKDCFVKEYKLMDKKYKNFGRNSNVIDWETWWIELVKNVFHSADPNISTDILQTLAARLIYLFQTSECWSHIQGNHELLEKLKENGKTLGVISNSDPRLTCILYEMKLINYFDFVLSSYEAGYQKPDKEIFKIPLVKCDIKPEEALHIGNTYTLDYKGARDAGWSSLLIQKDTTKLKDMQSLKKEHVFESLVDLRKALETKDICW